jgi:hypothetical protein
LSIRNNNRNGFGPLDGVMVILKRRARWIDKPMAVFDVETIAWHLAFSIAPMLDIRKCSNEYLRLTFELR